MKAKGLGKCLFDMLRGFFWILLAYILAYILSELLGEKLMPEMPDGLFQFYPYVFILVITICRISVVEKNIKRGTSSKRIHLAKQFMIVQLIIMVFVPIAAMIILAKSKYMNISVYLIKKDNLWILTTIVFILLLYMIVFIYDICDMYFYNLPIFIFIMLITLAISMNFAVYITPVLVKSFHVAAMVMLVIFIGEIVMAMYPCYWMFCRK